MVSLATRAQSDSDKVELFGGYSYMWFDHSPKFTNATRFSSFEVSGEYKFTDWLGGVGEFGAGVGNLGIPPSILTFLAGPQVSYPGRISPFAHVLVGGARFAGGDTVTNFSTAIGGGLDWKIGRHFSWRIVQGDYLMTRFFSATQHNARASTGIGFRF
jgi:hypothetical protein